MGPSKKMPLHRIKVGHVSLARSAVAPSAGRARVPVWILMISDIDDQVSPNLLFAWLLEICNKKMTCLDLASGF